MDVPEIGRLDNRDPGEDPSFEAVQQTIMHMIVTPISFVSFLLNLMAVWVWSAERDDKPLTFLFKSLSWLDTGYSLFFVAWWYTPLEETLPKELFRFIQSSCIFLIIFVTTVITIIRYLTVFWPEKADRWLSTRLVKRALGVYTAFIVADRVVVFILWEVHVLNEWNMPTLWIVHNLSLQAAPTFVQAVLGWRLMVTVCRLGSKSVHPVDKSPDELQAAGERSSPHTTESPRHSSLSDILRHRMLMLLLYVRRPSSIHSKDTPVSASPQQDEATPPPTQPHNEQMHLDNHHAQEPLCDRLHDELQPQLQEEQQQEKEEHVTNKNEETHLAALAVAAQFHKDPFLTVSRNINASISSSQRRSSHPSNVSFGSGLSIRLLQQNLSKRRKSASLAFITGEEEIKRELPSTFLSSHDSPERRKSRELRISQRQMTCAVMCFNVITFLSYGVMVVIVSAFRMFRPDMWRVPQLVMAGCNNLVSCCNFFVCYIILGRFRALLRKRLASMENLLPLSSEPDLKNRKPSVASDTDVFTLPGWMTSSSFRRTYSVHPKTPKQMSLDLSRKVERSGGSPLLD